MAPRRRGRRYSTIPISSDTTLHATLGNVKIRLILIDPNQGLGDDNFVVSTSREVPQFVIDVVSVYAQAGGFAGKSLQEHLDAIFDHADFSDTTL